MSTTTPSRDEQRLAEMGYSQDLTRAWSGFSNFAISFTIISILAGCFTTYGQAWNNGGPIAISIGWPLISCMILLVAFCMSELVSAYPTAGGIYWWATELGGTAWGWFTGWFNLVGLRRSRRVGRLRVRDVHLGAAEPLEPRHRGAQLRRRRGPRRRLRRLHGRAGPARADQHLLVAHGGGLQQHLRLVARGRRRGDRRDPDHRAGPARQCGLRVHRHDQQLRLRRRRDVLALRAATRVPADAVHDHGLRRLGAHL